MFSASSALFWATTLTSLLSSGVAADGSEQWKITFYQGIQCTGTEVASQSDPNPNVIASFCGPIPDVGFTSAADYQTFNEEYSYDLGFHQNSDCSDDGGTFEGITRQVICAQTDGAKYYSFTPSQYQGAKNKRSSFHERRGLAVRGSTEVEKRQGARAAFTLGAGVASVTFFYMGAGTCPATANDANANSAQCGISITTGVVLAFIAATPHIRGIRQIYGRDLDSITSALPVNELTSLVGHSLSMAHLGSLTDDNGVNWAQYSIELQDMTSKHTMRHYLHLHPDKDRQYISSHTPARQINATSTQSEQPSRIQERANRPTAYYAWENMDVNKFNQISHNQQTANKLGEQLWNYSKQNNRGECCADLTVNGQKINQGNYAMIAGTFTDESGFC